jgi:predicted RNase H-like HicB family nuclease
MRVNTKRTYTVILRAEPEGGFSVLVPALPGCFSCGDTIPEALRMAEEAIQCHLTGLRKLGKALPREGARLGLPAEEVTGTLLAYKISVDLDPEVAKVA